MWLEWADRRGRGLAVKKCWRCGITQIHLFLEPVILCNVFEELAIFSSSI
jgi:hypothetical protein